MTPFIPPTFKQGAFNCPYCGAYSQQSWKTLMYYFGSGYTASAMDISVCSHCDRQAYWYDQILIIPDASTVPIPNDDMPEHIKADYFEASYIINKSPRGAAALLRLCLQKLMVDLGESGKDINKDIASLVKKGLPVEVQQALDIVRVIGNEAVHPGELDIKDDSETAMELFALLNFIVDDRISRPKNIEIMFQKLPEEKRKGILKRDSK